MEFDVLIRNGEVVDGSRNGQRRRADVGIRDDRIAAIGDLRSSSGETEIDAAGRIVAPGFVDVHIHSEIELLGGPHRYASLLQGVTTQLLTPDGFGWAPLTPEQARSLWEGNGRNLRPTRTRTKLGHTRCLPRTLPGQHPCQCPAAGAAYCGPAGGDGLGFAAGDGR